MRPAVLLLAMLSGSSLTGWVQAQGFAARVSPPRF